MAEGQYPGGSTTIRTAHGGRSSASGRKNAKTTFAAFLLLLHLVGPEGKDAPNSHLHSAAQSRDQAASCLGWPARSFACCRRCTMLSAFRETAKELICPWPWDALQGAVGRCLDGLWPVAALPGARRARPGEGTAVRALRRAGDGGRRTCTAAVRSSSRCRRRRMPTCCWC